MTPEQLLERLESAERVATGPPAEVGSRVWAAIEGRLASGPAAPELDQEPLFDHPMAEAVTEAAAEAASSVGSSSVVLKIVGALGIVGVVGGGLALLDNRDRDPEPEQVAAAIEPSTPAEPNAVEPEPALPEPQIEPEPEPALAEPAESEEPQLPEPSKPANKKLQPKAPAKTLADEVALMQAISTALKQGDSRKVLKLVAEHERDFGKGQFLEERRAAKARALCQAGKLSAGKKEAVSFASRWPDSIHLTSVKQDCGLE
jgi:hypothetical protein